LNAVYHLYDMLEVIFHCL